MAKASHANYDGRITRPETIHLTLAFLGNVDRDDLTKVVQAGERVAAGSFEIRFDHVACWRHNRIVYLAPSQPPQGLFKLVEQLEAALAEQSLHFDRRAYRPHITLLRHASCSAETHQNRPGTQLEHAIDWPADEFVLVESKLSPAGASYQTLARFKLS